MSIGADPIEIVEFTRVDATARTALLRIAYRSTDPGETSGAQEALLVRLDDQLRRLPALPAPPGGADPKRAAFAVAVELLEPGAEIALRVGEVVVPLAHPTAHSGTPAGVIADAPWFDRLARQTERLARLQGELEDLREAHEQAQDRLRLEASGRSPLEIENAELRQRLELADARTAETTRLLRERCEELERRLAEVSAELQAVAQAEQQSSREARHLRGQVDALSARLEEHDGSATAGAADDATLRP